MSDKKVVLDKVCIGLIIIFVGLAATIAIEEGSKGLRTSEENFTAAGLCSAITPHVQLGEFRTAQDILSRFQASSHDFRPSIHIAVLNLNGQSYLALPSDDKEFRKFDCSIPGVKGTSVTFLFYKIFWSTYHRLIIFMSFSVFLFSLFFLVNRFHSKRLQKLKSDQEQQARFHLAQQVAHDIRSPVAALKAISKSIISENSNEGKILNRAIDRIGDISNLLLKENQYFSKNSKKNENRDKAIFLIPFLESIISEKRVEWTHRSRARIALSFGPSFDYFAKFDKSQLSVILSNLLNNSLEVVDHQDGTVQLDVSDNEDFILITITDNGKGMSPEVLEKLGVRGFSTKQKSELSGSGLGIFHAKNYIRKAGGSITFSSTLCNGTIVRIQLPKEKAPNWFAGTSVLESIKNGIVIDDEKSVFEIWQEKLPHLDRLGRLKYLNSLSLVSSLIPSSKPYDEHFFLVDHDFSGSSVHGVDWIINNSVQNNSILVTNRFDDPELIQKCEEFGVKLLPKYFLTWIQCKAPTQEMSEKKRLAADSLSYSSEISYQSLGRDGGQAGSSDMKSPDLVLIDDDDLVHDVWSIQAEKKNLELFSIKNTRSVLEEIRSIHRDAPIYLDYYLEDGIDSFSVAEQLRHLGFSKIFLATGLDSGHLSYPTFIKGIQGKEFPKIDSCL